MLFLLSFAKRYIAKTCPSPPSIPYLIPGYSLRDLSECLIFMRPYAQTIREKGEAELKPFKEASKDDWHNIQTHEVDLELLVCLLKLLKDDVSE